MRSRSRRTRADLRRLALLGALLLVAACAGTGGRDGAPRRGATISDLPGDAIPRDDPPSRYGNGPSYEVFGKRYRVMDSSRGYAENGVASWYGKKFHGRLTSSREPYDMYAMTAAHKTLPLPTYVRVRNLQNDRSVVVRVNDRGPFISNRIIDLSYAAALKLDMVRDGTSLVEVTAIGFDEPVGDRPTSVTSAAPSSPQPDIEAAVTAQRQEQPGPGDGQWIELQPTPADDSSIDRPSIGASPNTPSSASPMAAQDSVPADGRNTVYVQVGAFGSRDNAERRHALLRSRGIGNATVYVDQAVEPVLYRVRIGPIVNAIQYDLLVEELQILGIADPYLVND